MGKVFWKVNLVAQIDSSHMRIQKASVVFTYWGEKRDFFTAYFFKTGPEITRLFI